jgi:type I restriction enzyme S subunit
MSLPRYAKYKDSGVKWLGEVPEHWQIERLKTRTRLVTERASQQINPVALENIESWSGRLLPSDTKFEGDGVAFQKGDILFGKLRPYLAKAYLAPTDGEAVGDFHVIRPSTEIQGEFLLYQLLNRDSIDLIDGSTFGAKMPRASWDFMANMILAAPSQKEQVLIAIFLDRETAKIDALVEEQRRLIELLKEKRQAVISHAVTKGLNPNAPMKPSGAEWLGEVPEHWKISRLKRLIRGGSTISYGIVQPGEPQDEGVPFIQTTNISSGNFGLNSLQTTTVEIARAYPRSILHGGEVILGIRASIGAAHVVPQYLNGVNLSRGVARIECNEQIMPTYLVWVMRSESVFNYWQLCKQGSTFNEVSIATVRELGMSIPPIEEQCAIDAFLDSESKRFDRLINEANHAMELLQERRSALISAAVTGKIDVRGLAKESAA